MDIAEVLWQEKAYSEMYSHLCKHIPFIQAGLNQDRRNGLVIGNIFFHLRMGQVKYELCETEADRTLSEIGSPLDELTRAVASGGFEILQGEDKKYQDLIKNNLKPPKGSLTWEESLGVYVDTPEEVLAEFPLCHAQGYINHVLQEKYLRRKQN